MSENISTVEFLLAVSGGFLPALLWLWFWLKEDRHPEPRSFLILTFFGGMLAVIASLFIENEVCNQLYKVTGFICNSTDKAVSLGPIGLVALFLWALAEEGTKYFMAWFFALRKKVYDEPIDALIYLITAALGFVSLENMFFIIESFSAHGLLLGFITGNLRFVGASLLHVASSAVIGVSIAYSFFHKEHRWRNAIGGLLLATILHFIFNYSIISNEGRSILNVFVPLWLGVIVIIFLFERVKKLKVTSR